MSRTTGGGGRDVLARLSHLVDPARRRLYEFVSSRPDPVTREEAAAATGISRTLAAYHLDKLTDAGLVEAGYARPEGRRGGPGAGRPAKHYSRVDEELSVTLPARSYLMMANLLAGAVAADPTGSVRAAAAEAARNVGVQAGRAAADGPAGGGGLESALRESGYQPARTGDGDIELLNCPFHQLARSHTELVCELNLDLVRGVLEGAGDRADCAVLRPREGQCCVVIRGS